MLNAGSSIVIFKSAGISAHQILAPLVIAALGIAVVNFAFNERVVVKANKALSAWQAVNYGRVGKADAGNELAGEHLRRREQVIEELVGGTTEEVLAEVRDLRVFVHDQHPAGLQHALADRPPIIREDTPQIQDIK